MKLKALITEFANRLKELVEADAMERARVSVLRAFGIDAPRKPGRPPKMAATAATSVPVAKKARKKPPRQLCPVPGCKNTAAPIFGMVCAKHKGVKKSLIKKYREARKAKKLGLKPPTRKRMAKKAARKPMPKKTVRRRTANGARKPAAMPKPVTAPQPAAESAEAT